MKKFYLVICLIGISLTSFGQTFLFEDFSSNQMPPAGWTIDNNAAQWSINNGNSAGGIAPEGMFTWTNGTSTSRLISPAVDLTGLNMVSFQFMHYLDDYSGSGYSLGVATRSGGGDWNDVWTVNPTGNIGPVLVDFDITNDDVGQSDFQICLYISGNMYNFDYWYIDDIWLYLPLNLDAGLLVITTSSYLAGPSEVSGIIKNYGSSVITSTEICWQVDDGEVFTTLFNGLSLNFCDTYDFICDQMMDFPVGSYNLKVWIATVNGVQDDNPSNDMAEKDITFVCHTVQHRPCLEEFTSSTCGPCAPFNASFVPWCNTHEDEITLVKYQMDWPGNGDPYYTAEGGVRRNWYGVSWVPWTNLDGTYTDNNLTTINNMFNASMDEPGLVKVIGSNTLSGTVMDINMTALAFADFSNVVIHIVVFEYMTTGNVGSNGETEFFHVMMKMVPDAYGTTVSLEDRVPFSISETVDLAGTNVEEWDDLGVVVIVQDLGSKYIYQSDYTIEDGSFASDATLMSLTVDGEPIPDFSPDVFEYTITLPSGTVEVPLVEATVNDLNALAIIIPANELPGSTTVDVFAEDLATYNTYIVNFDLGTGIINSTIDAVRIYPNPTTGKVFVSGADNAQVNVYNTTGEIVASFSDFSSTMIDLSELSKGIYIMNIEIDNNTVLYKKIILMK